MKHGRRGFLKGLGKAIVATPLVALPAAAVVSPETIQAFRFQCDCGENITAPVPKKEGLFSSSCEGCSRAWVLNWKGTNWTVRRDHSNE
jgi:hypothetical protein